MTKKSQLPIKGFLKRAKGWVDAKDRGALADLRRGFSPGTEHRCWPYIAVYCDLSNKRERIIWQTVAAGFATFEQTADSGNLGAAMRRLALDGASGSPEDALRSFDARFRRLLTCDSAVEVCERLPGIIKAAKSKNIMPIDFEVLYKDLFYWRERVKIRWAASYWGGQKDDKDDEAHITTSLQKSSQSSNEQGDLKT